MATANFAGQLQFARSAGTGEVFQFTISADGSFSITDALPGSISYFLAPLDQITEEAKDVFQNMLEQGNLGLEVPNNAETLEFIGYLAAYRVSDALPPDFALVRVTCYSHDNINLPVTSD